MQNKNSVKNIGLKIESFLEFRNGLSSEERKMESGLLIEEMKSVDADSAYHKVSNRINHLTPLIFTIRNITRIAAIITLPLLVFTIWSLFFQQDHSKRVRNEIAWHEIQSFSGMRYHVVLPDGTDLWLNAESKIRYSVPFTQEKRVVELTGEAFFKVMRNDNVPFIVNAGDAMVKVTGTQFNVKAYADEELLEIALTEGSIDFTGTISEGKKASATLIPNDYLVLNKATGQVRLENKNLSKYTAWVNNIIVFNETPMSTVAKTLERWYGVNVMVTDSKLNKYRFTATFENESLFRVLELLELSSPAIKISYSPGKINAQTNIATKSTVTITKD